MSYFLVDGPDPQWIHFVHLACDGHRLDANNVQLGGRKAILFCVEVSVHQLDAIEEGLVGELIGGGDFHHPIYHLGSEVRIDLMLRKTPRQHLPVLFLFQDLLAVEHAKLPSVGHRLPPEEVGPELDAGRYRLVQFLVIASLMEHGKLHFSVLIALLEVVLLVEVNHPMQCSPFHSFIIMFY